MSSINDWAAQAAARIKREVVMFLADDPNYESFAKMMHANIHEARIAAIIATYGEPIVKLLQESRLTHSMMCPRWNADEDDDDVCECDAGEWNARVDAALDGR